MPFAAMQMELEIIIQVSQKKKQNKYHILTLI